MSTFIDTSAFMAILDADDPNHESAKRVWIDLVSRKEPMLTSSYVVVETASILHSRHGVSAVRWLQSDMLPVVHIEWVDKPLHEAGMSAVLAGTRHGPSLVDCISFEIIARRDIVSVLAYDRHFDDRGLGLLAGDRSEESD